MAIGQSIASQKQRKFAYSLLRIVAVSGSIGDVPFATVYV